ncbi:malate dehydrogenase [Spiroplasma helicoides]|uniref:Malate dehydrogenase n=1 Tax=Spiroplasma helicoides TaxID=216938 RepID=A0A1B3SLN8_9MOLU|nr:NADP-dependent malic enzyme [Spiroplasma helicoides]AOG60848.1 malate dehydrogenase [Spiroplasma helicoides]
MKDFNKIALELHKKYQGKLSVEGRASVKDQDDLSWVYTPGVAQPCKEIFKDREKMYDYTLKSRTVAVITDGSAVLGLGNIGAEASIPVMEGKSLLLKEFGGVDSFLICVQTQDPDEFVNVVKNIAPVFGGINLEDISAPKCIDVENRLKEILDIPVFHDDQHGTAIILGAAVLNAAKVANKKVSDLVISQSGTGAAGINIIKMLKQLGVKEIRAFNINGVVNSSTKSKNDKYVNQLLDDKIIHDNDLKDLADIVKGSDVFIGVSVANILTEDMIKSMNDKPIVFAMANPDPEIKPELAKNAGVYILGTGRSDYPNQINNVLAFPGIFKALLVTRQQVTDEVKLATAKAIASCVPENELSPDKVIPNPFDKKVPEIIYETLLKIANK